MSGKGSKPRPHDKKRFNDNWDSIFKKPKDSPSQKPADSSPSTRQSTKPDPSEL